MGDSSDEIPSVVKGFGEASIIKFVNAAYEKGIDPNETTVYENMFKLASEWEEKRSAKSVKKLTEECLMPLRKNLRLMDFRECPYGLNKREELQKFIDSEAEFDADGAVQLLNKLEMKTMLALPYSPAITRLT